MIGAGREVAAWRSQAPVARFTVLRASVIAADADRLSGPELEVLATVRGARRRDEWIRGRIAIRSVLGDHVSTVVDPDGAPRLVGSTCNISLSHDGDFIVVAVAAASSRVGVDLCLNDHASRVEQILRWLDVQTKLDPIACWAALEAVLKLRRLSIEALRDRVIALCLHGDAIAVGGIGDDSIVRICNAPDYAIGLATELA